jgi:DNA-binding response OmpR family regulator
MMEASMEPFARRIEREFKREMSQPHPLIGGPFRALSIADEMDACEGYLCAGMPANATDQGFRTVLVVEDEEPLRATVSDILRDYGFDVRAAATVGDARRLLASMPTIDILFSDVGLPDGSGLELAKWCREVRPHVRILLTSGSYRTTSVDEFLVLPKPYSFIALLRLLKQLSSRPAARPRPIDVSNSDASQALNFQDAKCGRPRRRME